MTEGLKNSNVKLAYNLSKWFSVKVEIRIFGHVIWSYEYPPKSNDDE